jgi:hypothetical protein
MATEWLPAGSPWLQSATATGSPVDITTLYEVSSQGESLPDRGNMDSQIVTEIREPNSDF